MAVIGKVLESLGYFAYQNSTFLVVFSLSFPHPESVPQSWFFLVVASAVLSIITQWAQTYFGKSFVCRCITGIMCFHTEVP